MRHLQPRALFWVNYVLGYEIQTDGKEYTGWYRCKNGALADGRWPMWNYKTGETRYIQT